MSKKPDGQRLCRTARSLHAQVQVIDRQGQLRCYGERGCPDVRQGGPIKAPERCQFNHVFKKVIDNK